MNLGANSAETGAFANLLEFAEPMERVLQDIFFACQEADAEIVDLTKLHEYVQENYGEEKDILVSENSVS